MQNFPPDQKQDAHILTAEVNEDELPQDGKQIISIEQTRLGLFVELDLSWMDHPFLLRSFLIKTPEQLQVLNNLGLEEIIYDPSRSVKTPLPRKKDQPVEGGDQNTPVLDEMWKEKHCRIECMKAYRQKMRQCDKQFEQSVGFMKKAMLGFRAHPKTALDAIKQMVDGMLATLLDTPDMALYLVNAKRSRGIAEYAHFVNVTVLSMMLGKALDLDEHEMRLLGIGALFHDLGKLKIPEKVLRKKEPLNNAEESFLQMHPLYGVKIARESGVFPAEVMLIIAQHHEALDGSGYPKGLKAKNIHKLTQIIMVADAYDLYCNQADADRSLSPYEAISLMFAKEKSKYNEDILKIFISALGVYPPGTAVELSGDQVGVVISINAGELLKPNILLYDENIPKDKAIVVDLCEDDELQIIKSLRPSTLPEEVFDYLDLGRNISHYFACATEG